MNKTRILISFFNRFILFYNWNILKNVIEDTLGRQEMQTTSRQTWSYICLCKK